jgi:hypothetical protein
MIDPHANGACIIAKGEYIAKILNITYCNDLATPSIIRAIALQLYVSESEVDRVYLNYYLPLNDRHYFMRSEVCFQKILDVLNISYDAAGRNRIFVLKVPNDNEVDSISARPASATEKNRLLRAAACWEAKRKGRWLH